jgi:hypothetical protein
MKRDGRRSQQHPSAESDQRPARPVCQVAVARSTRRIRKLHATEAEGHLEGTGCLAGVRLSLRLRHGANRLLPAAPCQGARAPECRPPSRNSSVQRAQSFARCSFRLPRTLAPVGKRVLLRATSSRPADSRTLPLPRRCSRVLTLRRHVEPAHRQTRRAQRGRSGSARARVPRRPARLVDGALDRERPLLQRRARVGPADRTARPRS